MQFKTQEKKIEMIKLEGKNESTFLKFSNKEKKNKDPKNNSENMQREIEI